MFVECDFRKPGIVSFKVQDLSKNVHNSLATRRLSTFENNGKSETEQ